MGLIENAELMSILGSDDVKVVFSIEIKQQFCSLRIAEVFMEKKKIYLVLTLVFIVLFIAVCLIDLFLENLEKKQELLLKVLEIISASSISFTLSCTISIKKSNRNNKTKVKSKNSNGVLVTQNNGDNNTTNLTYNNPVDIVKAVKETLVPYQEENVEKIMSKSIDALRKELPGQTLNKDFVMKYIDEASKINE